MLVKSLLILLLLPLNVYAQEVIPGTIGPDVAFEWDYPDDVNEDGFRVYCNSMVVWEGQAKRTTRLILNIGFNTCFVRAYKADEESGDSNSLYFVFVQDVPESSTNLRFEQ